MDAGEDFDQRRFAGAVVADQRHDFTGAHVEVDVGQRRDGAEVLGDAAQAEDWLRTSRRRASEISLIGFGLSKNRSLGSSTRGPPDLGRKRPGGSSHGAVMA